MDELPKLKVGLWRDLLVAGLVWCITLCSWLAVFFAFGDKSNLDSNFVTFLGGVLAISGLLFRQYMLKEVLDYLKSWSAMGRLLRGCIDLAADRGMGAEPLVDRLREQEKQAKQYEEYVRRELSFVPVIPLALILLYGCALLSSGWIVPRIVFLLCMVYGVAYLAVAALSSTRLAWAVPDLEGTLSELESLQSQLRSHDKDIS